MNWLLNLDSPAPSLLKSASSSSFVKVFVALGMAVPRFWNPMHDGLTAWFIVLEGLLLPIALYITDPFFSEAVKQSFRRRSAKYSDFKGKFKGR